MMLSFSALFQAETFINGYVVFVYSSNNPIIFFRMSNLIHPFASPMYAYDLYGVFCGSIFCFMLLAKYNVLTVKNVHKLHQKQPVFAINCFY